jgi:signal peptidase I
LKTSLMSALTGVLYAALVAYLGGWYIGRWNGNFALLLFILTAVTMLYWLAERFHFAPARRAAADALAANDAKRRETLVTSSRPASRSCSSPGGWTGPRACSR